MSTLHVAGVPVLICPPASRIPAVPATAGDCTACGSAVWVSEAMAPVVADGEARPVCERCMTRAVAQGITLVPLQHAAQRVRGMTEADWAAMTARILDRIGGGR